MPLTPRPNSEPPSPETHRDSKHLTKCLGTVATILVGTLIGTLMTYVGVEYPVEFWSHQLSSVTGLVSQAFSDEVFVAGVKFGSLMVATLIFLANYVYSARVRGLVKRYSSATVMAIYAILNKVALNTPNHTCDLCAWLRSQHRDRNLLVSRKKHPFFPEMIRWFTERQRYSAKELAQWATSKGLNISEREIRGMLLGSRFPPTSDLLEILAHGFGTTNTELSSGIRDLKKTPTDLVQKRAKRMNVLWNQTWTSYDTQGTETSVLSTEILELVEDSLEHPGTKIGGTKQ